MPKDQASFDKSAVDTIVDGLTQTLAETTVLTTKAQNFHWNVTGMSFGPLHELFQKIYEDGFAAQDDLAERIKALGGHADGRLSVYLERSSIDEASASKVSAREMIAALQADSETLSATSRRLAETAESQGDLVTHDMAIERAETHDQFAWFLRAHLDG